MFFITRSIRRLSGYFLRSSRIHDVVVALISLSPGGRCDVVLQHTGSSSGRRAADARSTAGVRWRRSPDSSPRARLIVLVECPHGSSRARVLVALRAPRSSQVEPLAAASAAVDGFQAARLLDEQCRFVCDRGPGRQRVEGAEQRGLWVLRPLHAQRQRASDAGRYALRLHAAIHRWRQ